MKPVTYKTQGNIATICLDHPPVNSLSHELRIAILETFQAATADADIKAIVIASNGKLFSAGADIVEFASGQAFAEPNLPALCNAIDDSEKLVVAALNGSALGGGCELALACDHRFALSGVKMGLPEVNLGLIPGAGGTQRLPRLAGPEIALDMIASGKPMAALKLLEAGVVDRLHEDSDDFLQAAIAYAEELLEANTPARSFSQIKVDSEDLPDDFFPATRSRILSRSRGMLAPERAIDAIEFACNSSLSEGLSQEAEIFQECMKSPQARALQHLFFAEREVVKIPGIDPGLPARQINKVAIIGSGTMGGGIAMNFVNAGIETKILDLSAEALERGLAAVRKNYEISVKKGRFTETQVQGFLSLLGSTTDYSDIADADLVIEAVFEKIEIKKQVFETLDRVCAPGTILATNTSTLDVNEIASVTSRPGDVIGLHFFTPANVMRLLEVVRGEKTADDVIVSAIGIARKIKKVPVVVGVCWGFIGNRMLEVYGRESDRMILEGASPAQIDRVLYDFGLPMGYPCVIDLAGLDIGYLIRQGNAEAFYGRDPNYAAVADKLYELGRYGQKTGRGFYQYQGREKTEDPEVLEIASSLAKDCGMAQREISDQEIFERIIYAMINEGAQILDEGIALRAGDIDIVYCNGYGFPVYRGGPMHYADEIGLEKVLQTIERYRQALGTYGDEWFKPAPLLQKLVAEGKKFGSAS